MPGNDTEELVKVAAGLVTVITLNRPEKLNAINAPMHAALRHALRAVNDDPQCRVVVITGAGRGFCSGGDVDVQASSETGGNATRLPGQVMGPNRYVIDELLAIEAPVIAMVNGPAAGSGATYALFSDFVFMSETAVLGDPHVSRGLVAGDGAHVIWPLLCGPPRAKEMLITGKMLNASEAYDLGLVNHVCAPEELEPAVMEFAKGLAEMDPFAVRATKRLVNRYVMAGVESSLDLGLSLENETKGGPAHRAAAQGFIGTRAQA
jgi:enoyl-CoA hydratase